MFLKGKNITVRALEPSDADVLYKWENNMALWPVSFTQVPFSRFILEEFVNSSHHDIYTNKQLRLMVNSSDTHETIGILDLFDFDPRNDRCGIGIYIEEKHRKKGYALECISIIKDYCFKTLLLKQVYVHVNSDNSGSLALFEKAGFNKACLKKSWNKTALNTFEDVWFLQCINNEE
jgi:diamine N-acetyltransferase